MSIVRKIKKADGMLTKAFDQTPSDQYWQKEKENRLQVAQALFGKSMAKRRTKAKKYAFYDKVETKTHKVEMKLRRDFLLGMQHLLDKQLAEASR